MLTGLPVDFPATRNLYVYRQGIATPTHSIPHSKFCHDFIGLMNYQPKAFQTPSNWLQSIEDDLVKANGSVPLLPSHADQGKYLSGRRKRMAITDEDDAFDEIAATVPSFVTTPPAPPAFCLSEETLQFDLREEIISNRPDSDHYDPAIILPTTTIPTIPIIIRDSIAQPNSPVAQSHEGLVDCSKQEDNSKFVDSPKISRILAQRPLPPTFLLLSPKCSLDARGGHEASPAPPRISPRHLELFEKSFHRINALPPHPTAPLLDNSFTQFDQIVKMLLQEIIYSTAAQIMKTFNNALESPTTPLATTTVTTVNHSPHHEHNKHQFHPSSYTPSPSIVPIKRHMRPIISTCDSPSTTKCFDSQLPCATATSISSKLKRLRRGDPSGGELTATCDVNRVVPERTRKLRHSTVLTRRGTDLMQSTSYRRPPPHHRPPLDASRSREVVERGFLDVEAEVSASDATSDEDATDISLPNSQDLRFVTEPDALTQKNDSPSFYVNINRNLALEVEPPSPLITRLKFEDGRRVLSHPPRRSLQSARSNQQLNHHNSGINCNNSPMNSCYSSNSDDYEFGSFVVPDSDCEMSPPTALPTPTLLQQNTTLPSDHDSVVFLVEGIDFDEPF